MKKTLIVSVLALFLTACGGGAKEDPNVITLYYSNPKLAGGGENDCAKVLPVGRKVSPHEKMPEVALSMLFWGPTEGERSQGFTSVFSEKTRGAVNIIEVIDGVAHVNLRKEVKGKSIYEALNGANTSCGSMQFFAQVQKTAFHFPNIKRVVFSIEGDRKAFYEWMQRDVPTSDEK